jgi:hypothetical protein
VQKKGIKKEKICKVGKLKELYNTSNSQKVYSGILTANSIWAYKLRISNTQSRKDKC